MTAGTPTVAAGGVPRRHRRVAPSFPRALRPSAGSGYCCGAPAFIIMVAVTGYPIVYADLLVVAAV